MKKLLGFLGTITIAGSGMAGLVGNASASEKNEINYLQTSNLKKLNRKRRSPQNQGWNQPFPNTQFDNSTREVIRAITETTDNIGSIIRGIGSASCRINPNQQACQQQPQFNKKPIYPNPGSDPNAPSEINPGKTQREDWEDFSRGMQKIERLANQQRNY